MRLKLGMAFAACGLLLAGCTQDAPTEAAPVETGGEASGDVLRGSISDDMIPLEELTSTSPRAEPTGTANGARSSSGSGGGTAPAGNDAGEAAADAGEATDGPPVAEPLTPVAPVEDTEG